MLSTGRDQEAKRDPIEPVIVTRDGETIAVRPSDDDAFAWLLRHQGQSVMYAVEQGGYAVEPAQAWDAERAAGMRRSEQRLSFNDPFHNSGGCRREGRLGRENCGVCCLLGYEPRGGFGDDWSVKRDGPNYGGWARIYVEAGRVIPERWRDAFLQDLTQEGPKIHPDHVNFAYASALARSIATFGVTFR